MIKITQIIEVFNINLRFLVYDWQNNKQTAKTMLKIALPLIMVTFSLNVMASAAITSEKASIPAVQEKIRYNSANEITFYDVDDSLQISAVDNGGANSKIDKNQSVNSLATKNTIHAGPVKTFRKIKAKLKPQPKVNTYTANENSLEKNIKGWAKQNGYHIVWDVTNTYNDDPADYQWIGKETIHGSTAIDVLKKLMKGYPVNTEVWSQNKVVCIDNNKKCLTEAAK